MCTRIDLDLPGMIHCIETQSTTIMINLSSLLCLTIASSRRIGERGLPAILLDIALVNQLRLVY